MRVTCEPQGEEDSECAEVPHGLICANGEFKSSYAHHAPEGGEAKVACARSSIERELERRTE